MAKIRYLSLFSGIEAFSCAVKDMPEYEPVAFAEIEPFPCAVLKHHYPDVPNLGDVTKIDGKALRGKVDLIVGGPPCQDWSVIGERAGLDGRRSVLALDYLRILDDVRPRWFIIENVPGLLNCNSGADFQVLLQKMDELRYHVAWRVLDSMHFGLPQRRKRVYIIGHSDGWACPAKVLFELEGMHRDPAEMPEKRKEDSSSSGAGFGGRRYIPRIAPTLTASGACFSRPGFPNQQLDALIVEKDGVRRLTIEEAEALQGFDRGYTAVEWKGKPAPDTARYRALGNSFTVDVVRWIAKRILMVEKGAL
ncbi:MAG: DNA cytosine methyltransferase [Fibrobacter sp.]|nr:DNA cytosine methyltransferase [Fibrobacter sp.]